MVYTQKNTQWRSTYASVTLDSANDVLLTALLRPSRDATKTWIEHTNTIKKKEKRISP